MGLVHFLSEHLMNPDHKAFLKQLDEHAQALRTDLQSVMRSPGVDSHQIRVAAALLETLTARARAAIIKRGAT